MGGLSGTRKLMAFAVLIATAMGLSATAAFAVDYPPTTAHTVVTVDAASATNTTVQAASATSSSGALPFTGGNSMFLVWIAVACLAAGAFAISRSRRKRLAE